MSLNEARRQSQPSLGGIGQAVPLAGASFRPQTGVFVLLSMSLNEARRQSRPSLGGIAGKKRPFGRFFYICNKAGFEPSTFLTGIGFGRSLLVQQPVDQIYNFNAVFSVAGKQPIGGQNDFFKIVFDRLQGR